MGGVLIWIILSIFPGMIAKNKGHQFFPYFLISLVLSPLVGFIWVLIMKPDEAGQIESGLNRKCPFCAEMIRPEAIVCRYCHKDLPPMPQEPPPPVIEAPIPTIIDRKAARKGLWKIFLAIIVLAIIALAADYFGNGYESIVFKLLENLHLI